MKVVQSQLARRLGLPANSHESTIRARLAGAEVKAAGLAQPAPRAAGALPAPWLSMPTADLMAFVQAAPDAELRSMLMSALGTPAQKVVAEELQDRDFLGRHFPAAARAAGYERPRVDLASREGARLKGIGH